MELIAVGLDKMKGKLKTFHDFTFKKIDLSNVQLVADF